VSEVQEGDVLKVKVIGVDQHRVEFDVGFEATGTMGLERLDTLVAQHPFFKKWYPDLRKPTALDIFEQGNFEDDLYHTEMLVRVRKIVERQGKFLVKLDFEAWLD
jgi:hypothetical protein